ncbi:MAG: hypothetical protein LBL58_15645 [Tannerellaceae bacterium]|jgi:hypothetical protein|nr:hypothetical protein [Tannerellaceae bacterium]
MKRLLFLMIWALFLSSCSEDEKPANNFIEGTKWQSAKLGSIYTDGGELKYSYQENYQLDFTDATFIFTKKTTYDRSVDGVYEDTYTVNGTYMFEYPETTLQSNDGKFTEKIKIEKYQITMSPDDSRKSLVFTKIRN